MSYVISIFSLRYFHSGNKIKQRLMFLAFIHFFIPRFLPCLLFCTASDLLHSAPTTETRLPECVNALWGGWLALLKRFEFVFWLFSFFSWSGRVTTFTLRKLINKHKKYKPTTPTRKCIHLLISFFNEKSGLWTFCESEMCMILYFCIYRFFLLLSESSRGCNNAGSEIWHRLGFPCPLFMAAQNGSFAKNSVCSNKEA